MNARSVIKKMDELRCTVSDVNPDVICITESWANDKHTTAFFSIDGYELVCRRDREDTDAGAGGGLLIWVRKSIAAPECRKPEFLAFNQSCCVKLPLAGGRHLDLVLVYRPHRVYDQTADLSAVKDNNALLGELFSIVSKPSVILGDFNCSDVYWDTGASGSLSRFLVQAAADNGFEHVTFATLKAGTMPDLVFASHRSMINDIEDIGYLGSSDHKTLLVTIPGRVPRATATTESVPDWRKANYEGLKQDAAAYDWDEQLANLSCDDSWTKLKEILDGLQTKHVPLKKRRERHRPVWMTKHVMRTIRKKRRLWKTYTTTDDYRDFAAYKAFEKETTKAVKNAKRRFERKLAKDAKKNPKEFYSYMKSKTSNRESVGPLKADGKDTEFVTSDEDMAEMLNEFFSSVFTDEDLTNVPTPEQKYHGNFPLHNVEITVEKVKSKIDSLRMGAAPGPDGITPRLLRSISDSIAVPLATIFKRSLDEGVVPEDWRLANVTPIYKKGGKSKVGNYRPVSLTAIICKLMEGIIKDAVTRHLLANDLLAHSQHGFMQRKSCLTNLLEYLDELTRLVDEGHNVDVVYLDFSKAFDKVAHVRLLRKLEAVGVGGAVLDWIRAWLNDRKQRVVLNGNASGWLPVLSGVPQGSVLGPLLFIVFINDIDSYVPGSSIYKFADDTKVLNVVDTEAERDHLQSNLEKLIVWAESSQMVFNADKCKVLHFGKHNQRFSYTMGGYAPAGTVLAEDSQEKDVGVIIHESLKPSAQCAKAASKAKQVLGQMARSITLRDKVTWPKLYRTYVRPHLEYGVQAWNPWTQADITVLEKVQEQAMRYVSGANSSVYEERLCELGLLSLKERRHRGDMIQVWKYLHHKQDVDPAALFNLRNSNVTRPTRLSTRTYALNERESRGEQRRHFFTVRVVKPWNNLPDSLHHATDVDAFKIEFDRIHYG